MSSVKLAESAGFCFGVKRAIEMAYAEIEKNDGEPLYSYGPLIHNKEVTNDLDAKGLHIIESLDGIDKGTVVIRSHGVGKFLYDALEEKGMKMVDGIEPSINVMVLEQVQGNTLENYLRDVGELSRETADMG
ncbi:MAG: hypothetical protein IJD29_02465, partial [Anaerotignum sp.]|nr:hypothetical protein [Anaerotignum sp.]